MFTNLGYDYSKPHTKSYTPQSENDFKLPTRHASSNINLFSLKNWDVLPELQIKTFTSATVPDVNLKFITKFEDNL